MSLHESIKAGLFKQGSPLLNALLPLIRQQIAAKTGALARRGSLPSPASPTVSTASVSPALSSASTNRIIGRRASESSTRSTEHRQSHKIAERKRRREMKDIFDALRDCLPIDRRKHSKWEILNEAVDIIDDLIESEEALIKQKAALLKEIEQLKGSN